MSKEYTKKELWKLYEKLPKELQEAIFAEETADYIGNICERYDINEEMISEIARRTGNVLLGILPPEDFQDSLEKELKIEKGAAKKIDQEIFRLIFYPVKTSLEEIYRKEIESPTGPTLVLSKDERPARAPVIETTREEAPKKDKKDTYREPID